MTASFTTPSYCVHYCLIRTDPKNDFLPFLFFLGHSTNNHLDRQVLFNIIFIRTQHFISSLVHLMLNQNESLKRIYEYLPNIYMHIYVIIINEKRILLKTHYHNFFMQCTKPPSPKLIHNNRSMAELFGTFFSKYYYGYNLLYLCLIKMKNF
jgi:hypothetical protein